MQNMTPEQFRKRHWRLNASTMETLSRGISNKIDKMILEEILQLGSSKYPFYAKHDPLSVRGMEDQKKL